MQIIELYIGDKGRYVFKDESVMITILLKT